MTRHSLERLLDQDALLELDRRYLAFVEALPPHLAQLAEDRRTLKGSGPSKPLQTVAEFRIHISGPWFFRDTFPNLTDEQLLDLGEGWIFLGAAMLLHDHLVDDQLPTRSHVAELQERLMARAKEIFHLLIGNRPIFWQRFEQYKQQVASALQSELHYRALPQVTYELTAAWHIGVGKSALFKAIPWAMVVLSDAPSYFVPLEASIDAYMAGGQLMDDIADWREDLDRGHYTYPLAQATSHLHNLGTKVSPQAIETLLFSSTLLKDLLAQAQAWYRQALSMVNGVPCQGWIDFLNAALEECTWYHRWLIIYQIAEAAREKDHITRR
jgi:hypothetical protein